MPCCLRLLAIRVAPSTSLMFPPRDRTDVAARLGVDGRVAKGGPLRCAIRQSEVWHAPGPRRRATSGVVEQPKHRGSLHRMAIYQLGDLVPVIPASCYIAPEATIIGQVTLGERVTVMSGAVIRGDNEPVVIGDDTNVQEGCVLHNDPGLPLTIGKGVT